MRLSFNAPERLKKRAEASLDDGTAQVRRWWSKKYSQPPNHPLFEERSMGSLQQEMFEDLMYRRNELREEIEEQGDKDGRRLKQLNEINRALGDDHEVQDDLFDYWDRELAAGRVPDLNMTVEDLRAKN